MTVQELIDQLQLVKDKSKIVCVKNFDTGRYWSIFGSTEEEVTYIDTQLNKIQASIIVIN